MTLIRAEQLKAVRLHRDEVCNGPLPLPMKRSLGDALSRCGIMTVSP
jgi:hypothetical protein